MKSQDLKKLNIPDKPGVYFFKRENNILYIGKATSLRSRVRSYFGKDLIATRGPVILDMTVQANTLKWEVTDSVLEALILEAELIKQHQPKYNTKEKFVTKVYEHADDNTWITAEVVRPIKESEFNTIIGINFDLFMDELDKTVYAIKNNHEFVDSENEFDEKIEDMMNELAQGIVSNDLLMADIRLIDHWGGSFLICTTVQSIIVGPTPSCSMMPSSMLLVYALLTMGSSSAPGSGAVGLLAFIGINARSFTLIRSLAGGLLAVRMLVKRDGNARDAPALLALTCHQNSIVLPLRSIRRLRSVSARSAVVCWTEPLELHIGRAVSSSHRASLSAFMVMFAASFIAAPPCHGYGYVPILP
jgi:hypothetical protein